MELKLNKTLKKWIDNASHEELLFKWKEASLGDPFFQGEVGQYYSKVMSAKIEVTTLNYKSCCDHCGHEVVICGKCGNNTCNGGYGTVEGTDCDQCPSAYAEYTGTHKTKGQ